MNEYKIEKVYIENDKKNKVEIKFDVLILIGNEWAVQRSYFDTYDKAENYIKTLNAPFKKPLIAKDVITKTQSKIDKLIEDGILLGPNMLILNEDQKEKSFEERINEIRVKLAISKPQNVIERELVIKIKELEKELELYKSMTIGIDNHNHNHVGISALVVEDGLANLIFSEVFSGNNEFRINIKDLIKQKNKGEIK